MKKRLDDWDSFRTLEGFVRLVLLVDWDPIGVLGYHRAIQVARYAEVCSVFGVHRVLLGQDGFASLAAPQQVPLA